QNVTRITITKVLHAYSPLFQPSSNHVLYCRPIPIDGGRVLIRRAMLLSAGLGVLVFAPGAPGMLAQQEEVPANPASRFVAYPTFRPRFHNQSETFSLLANFYLVNAAAQRLKEVT